MLPYSYREWVQAPNPGKEENMNKANVKEQAKQVAKELLDLVRERAARAAKVLDLEALEAAAPEEIAEARMALARALAEEREKAAIRKAEKLAKAMREAGVLPAKPRKLEVDGVKVVITPKGEVMTLADAIERGIITPRKRRKQK